MQGPDLVLLWKAFIYGEILTANEQIRVILFQPCLARGGLDSSIMLLRTGTFPSNSLTSPISPGRRGAVLPMASPDITCSG